MTAQQESSGLLFGNFSPELKILVYRITTVSFILLLQVNVNEIHLSFCPVLFLFCFFGVFFVYGGVITTTKNIYPLPGN